MGLSLSETDKLVGFSLSPVGLSLSETRQVGPVGLSLSETDKLVRWVFS